MLTLTNRIDMSPGAVPLVIHLGQYDSDFTLVFELYSSAGNFTVESGTTAMIRGTKTDGHAYDADATIDISAKTVTVAGSEQMTAAKGRNVYELVLTKSGKVLSTANFILDVERAAMDADTIASESVLKELNAIIAGAETATEAAADAASAADRAEDAADSVSSASTQIATNTADIGDLKADFEQLEPGLSAEAKAALLACFTKVAWIDEHGQDYYDALEAALYPSEYPMIAVTYTPGSHTVYTDDYVDSIKPYLTVTYYETAESAGEVISASNYTLTGTLMSGVSLIDVSYRGVSTTVSIPVVQPEIIGVNKYGTGVYPGTQNGVLVMNRDNRAVIVTSSNYPKLRANDFGTSVYTDSNYNPIKIPQGAKKVVCKFPASGWAAVWICTLDASTGQYPKTTEVIIGNFTGGDELIANISAYNDGTYFCYPFANNAEQLPTSDMTLRFAYE